MSDRERLMQLRRLAELRKRQGGGGMEDFLVGMGTKGVGAPAMATLAGAARSGFGTNLTDEFAGALTGLGGMLRGQPFKKGFSRGREATNRVFDRIQQEQPVAFGAGRTALDLIPAGIGGRLLARGAAASLPAVAARSAGGGAVGGAVAGAGDAPEGERVRQGVLGGLIGGVSGGALSGLGALGSAMLNRFRAAPRVSRAVQEGLDEAGGRSAVQSRLAADPNRLLADELPGAFQRNLAPSGRVPEVQGQLRERAAGAGGRLEKAVQGPQHIPRSAQEAGEELDTWMADNVGSKFTAAYADNVPQAGVGEVDKFWMEVRKPLGKRIWIDALRSKANARGQSPEQLEQNLKLLQRAQRFARQSDPEQATEAFEDLVAEGGMSAHVMDLMRRNLNDIRGKPDLPKAERDSAKAMFETVREDLIPSLYPRLDDAVQSARPVQNARAALEYGAEGDWLKSSPADLAKKLNEFRQGGAPEVSGMNNLRAGVVDYLKREIGNRPVEDALPSMLRNKQTQAALKEIFGGEYADRVARTMANEGAMQQTFTKAQQVLSKAGAAPDEMAKPNMGFSWVYWLYNLVGMGVRAGEGTRRQAVSRGIIDRTMGRNIPAAFTPDYSAAGRAVGPAVGLANLGAGTRLSEQYPGAP